MLNFSELKIEWRVLVMMNVRLTKNYKFYGAISLVLISITIGILFISTTPYIAGALGLSTGTATQVVSLISAYQTAAAIVSIVGALTGVGGITSGIVATVLFLLKKQGKAKAALW